uniref:hypothetical protein n=1 Tax=Persicitalea sp. TaxID=3100273 RepID=UPI0035938956
MNQSEKPKFEQEWQRAFESAAETPPPAAWDAIEKRLDGEEAAVVPLLWWKNPKVWYAAAAVAALLLVSWPILQLDDSQSSEQPQLTTHTPSSPNPANTTQAPDTEVPAVAAPGIESPGVTSLGSSIDHRERMAKGEDKRDAPLVFSPSTSTGSPERIAAETSRQSHPSAPQNPVAVRDNSSPALNDAPSLSGLSNDARTPGTLKSEFNKQREAFLNSPPTNDALVPRTPTIIVITQTTRKIPAGADSASDLERVITGSSTEPLRTPALTQSITALSPVDDLTKLGVDLR